MSTIREVDLYVEFYDNVLTCDTITFTVTIEAVTIGTFEVFPDDTDVSAAYVLDSPLPVLGTAVEIEYRVAEFVDDGCGSVIIGVGANTLTLTGE